jgi:hypothetical protein
MTKKWKSELALVVMLLPFLLPIRTVAQNPAPADAIALEQQGKLPEAAEAWRTITRRNPNDAAAFASLGVVLSKQQKYSPLPTKRPWRSTPSFP